MKKLASTCLALASLMLQNSAVASDTIRIGVDPTYPPFEYKQADGSLAGFEIDLGNAICEKVSKQCEWVPMSFDGLIPSLRVGKIDAVFSSLGISEKRKKVVDFSDRTWTGFSSMLSLSSKNLLPTAESLKGKVVGVQQGSMQEDYAKIKLAPFGIRVQSYQTQDQVYADLLNGRIDASMQDMTQAQVGFIEDANHPEFSNQKMVDKLLPADSAIALRKGDSKIATLINNGIKAIHADGTFATIQRQHFGDLDLYSK
ncbi:transporter substrate-binding domain-containing protein [Marinomonas posidonica]|uniref:ABC-type transporter, periplasmic subunit family 3 n=1 Tax=Marinomonas posidonica (strain CECT 7376 / NCIMB 14433 / IVIA-Po-181) TaxID=491952 RepID=F6D0N1_MARPP|nr:transporter substrate-binding domain-containing protein [Marinomonas posidonica]AEF54829.1 ABC-type transporter, periplasmic subunit family 3 [Marinomonas posidonica IVIA-Po-181]